jgi:hypothetical protein
MAFVGDPDHQLREIVGKKYRALSRNTLIDNEIQLTHFGLIGLKLKVTLPTSMIFDV